MAVSRGFICGMPPEPCALSGPALGCCNKTVPNIIWIDRYHITKMSFSLLTSERLVPDTDLYPHSLSYQVTSFMKEVFKPIPALASNILDLQWKRDPWMLTKPALAHTVCKKRFEEWKVMYLESPTKSFETTSSSVYPRMPLNGPSDAYLYSSTPRVSTVTASVKCLHVISTNAQKDQQI